MSIFGQKGDKVYIIDKIIKKFHGGGAFCTNRIAQKCLSVAVSLALAVGMVLGRQVQAVEPTVFTASAYPNHWGRSDLRAYLNNGLADVAADGTVSNKKFKLDSTADSDNTSGYAAHFSDAEFALVQLFRYMTYVYSGGNFTSAYELIDRFFLPSAEYGRYVAWYFSEDANRNTTYGNSSSYIIPMLYVSRGHTLNDLCWVRTPNLTSLYPDSYASYSYYHGGAGAHEASMANSLSAAFKISLEPIIFASAALPKDIVGDGDSGSKIIKITGGEGFTGFGTIPNYGMYPKTQSSNTSFSVRSAIFYNDTLNVTCVGGKAGQYAVVQVIKPDSLEDGTTTYVFAQKISSSSFMLQININEAWGEGSVNENDTIKVWMEDDSGSLAAATTPVTFVNGSKTETGAITNHRVFAMKKDLQCAWGNSALGIDATNQKIYFGSHNGVPLEFWIAGRETAANDGELDPNGEIMTLYQAKSVEARQFNASTSAYTVDDKPAVTLRLEQASVATSPYPADQITFTQGDTALNKANLVWLHRTPGTNAWLEGMPKVGAYEVRCYTPGTDNYERTYSNVVNFNIKKTPTRDLFNYIGGDKVYDGVKSQVIIKPKDGITGIGAVTIKCNKINADGTETPLEDMPTDAGRYRIKFDVAEGTNYGAASDLSAVF